MLRVPFVLLFIFALLNPVDSYCDTYDCKLLEEKLAATGYPGYDIQHKPEKYPSSDSVGNQIGLSQEEDYEDQIFDDIGKGLGKGLKWIGGIFSLIPI